MPGESVAEVYVLVPVWGFHWGRPEAGCMERNLGDPEAEVAQIGAS